MKKLLLTLLMTLFMVPAVFAVPESFAPVVKKAAPSVVNISTTKTVTRRVDPFFDGFFGGLEIDPFGGDFWGNNNGKQRERKYKSNSLGTGFVIDREGYIVTNNHVIDGADEIVVKFPDDKEFKAEIVGKDPLTDLALLKIDPKGSVIQPIVLGDSDAAEIGDWVLAIGNPHGFGGTVTAGILSAKGRALGEGPYDNFIQTDVSINPGNSGGPLINMNGEVIGINTAIIPSAQGLGFSVPVNMLKNILPRLKEGKVSRGWLGVTLQPLDEKLAKTFGIKDKKGVLIADVTQGEAGDKAGLKAGDVVVAVDGKDTLDSRTLVNVIGSKSPNERVRITVIRDGKRIDITAQLGERPAEVGAMGGYKKPQGVNPDSDIAVRDIDDKTAKSLGISSGVVVENVKENTGAFNAGLRKGDVIVWINKNTVKDSKSFYELYNKIKKSDIVALKVIAKNGSRFFAFNK